MMRAQERREHHPNARARIVRVMTLREKSRARATRIRRRFDDRWIDIQIVLWSDGGGGGRELRWM